MFKIGDKVKVNPIETVCAMRCSKTIRTIVKCEKSEFTGNIHHYVLDCCTRGVWPHEISLYIPKQLLTETDYLDAFQANFKDGI